ncbi:MAG: hypothetical protein K2X42_05665, partial [Burkholderiaceae bacterium]|nr:hypothetical protein [Burkholderiaceae bacterium]
MIREPHPWLCRAVTIGLMAGLAACGTSPGTSMSSSDSTSGSAGSLQRKPTLAEERQRLAELFQGTPVVLAIDRDGSLRAEVPLRHCFDPGRAVVK